MSDKVQNSAMYAMLIYNLIADVAPKPLTKLRHNACMCLWTVYREKNRQKLAELGGLVKWVARFKQFLGFVAWWVGLLSCPRHVMMMLPPFSSIETKENSITNGVHVVIDAPHVSEQTASTPLELCVQTLPPAPTSLQELR